MSFDLKLFSFEQQKPLFTFQNGSAYYKVFSKQNLDRKFTMKVYNIQSELQIEEIENEIKIQLIASAYNRNIVQVKGSTITEQKDEFGFISKKFWILLEEIQSNLEEIKNEKIRKNETFSLEQLVFIMKNLVNTLSQLEKNDIAHRNLQLSSIFFVDQEYKLGEFSYAINSIGQSSTCWYELKTQEKNYINQKHYIDPELQQSFLRGDSGAEVNYFKGDVYSLGMILLELCTLQTINPNFTNSKLKFNEKLSQVEKIYGQQVKNYLEQMIQPQRKDRPSFIFLNQQMYQNSISLNNQIQVHIEQELNKIVEAPVVLEQLSQIKEQTDESAGSYNKESGSSKKTINTIQQSQNSMNSNNIKESISSNSKEHSQSSNDKPQQNNLQNILESNFENSQGDKIKQSIRTEIQIDEEEKMVIETQDIAQHQYNQEQQLRQQKNQVTENTNELISNYKYFQTENLTEKLKNMEIDDISCQSYSVYIRDSKQYEQFFGLQKQIQIKNQSLLSSKDMSKKASQMILESLNMETNKTNYLFTFEQLQNGIKNLGNIQQLEKSKLFIDISNKQNDLLLIYACEYLDQPKKDEMSVFIVEKADNVQIYEMLYQINFFNGIKSTKILPLEFYSIESVDTFNSNLFLVHKKKIQSLQTLISQSLQLNIIEKVYIAQQLIELIYEIQTHSKGIMIIHGDIRPINILLDNKYNIYLTNFGFIQNLDKEAKQKLLCSPEQSKENRVENSTDIWTLGLIFYELFFDTTIDQETVKEWNLFDEDKKGYLKVNLQLIKNYIDQILSQMIASMTAYDPKLRLSLDDIKQQLQTLKQLLTKTMLIKHQQKKDEPNTNKSKSVKNLEIVGINKYSSHQKKITTPNISKQSIDQLSNTSNPVRQSQKIITIPSKSVNPPSKKRNSQPNIQEQKTLNNTKQKK